MHTVNRGPEPPGLQALRARYTPRWVAFYRDGSGKKPSDSKWREFHDDVGEAFFSLCGYCEAMCKGDVDHFRPKHRFPERVYQWDNWVLACHICNNKKGGEWPAAGYVDPCAKSRSAQAEGYFEFDTKTCEILPKGGLSAARARKAARMITDLALNAQHHRTERNLWLEVIAKMLEGRAPNDPGVRERVDFFVSREIPLSTPTLHKSDRFASRRGA